MNRVTLDHHDNDSNKKMRHNDSDNKMRLKELYSVSAFEDTPTISQSLSPTDARGDMNMNTKQDQHCNVKPPPLCGLTTDNNDVRHVSNIMTGSIMINNNSNGSNRKKKSVSFLPRVPTYPPSSNSIHTTTTPQYKSLWYTPNEYNQLKYQAALDCGIKLMQLNNVSSSQKNDGKKRKKKRGAQFIQIGDFDCKKNENINDNTTNLNVIVSHPSLSSMDTPPTDNTKDKKFSRYYNENEYNDTPVEEQNSSSTAAHGKVVDLVSNKPQQQQEEPTVVCKRGLGYHFSRTRKRARMSTRSAVLAWQKNLRGTSNTSNSRQATANDKSTMMLALVSSKCSRVAREEAKWRGLVDYKVAYPERHQELSIANEKVQLDNDMNMNDKKRPHDDSITAAAPIIHTDIASRSNKRQRPNDDTGNDTNKMQRWNGAVFEHNSSNRDELILSPETVGYLVNGVQYAKV